MTTVTAPQRGVCSIGSFPELSIESRIGLDRNVAAPIHNSKQRAEHPMYLYSRAMHGKSQFTSGSARRLSVLGRHIRRIAILLVSAMSRTWIPFLAVGA